MKQCFALFAFFVAGLWATSLMGQTGAYEYAVYLNNTGTFRHANNFGGAEVIYRTSGTATPEMARQSWMRSPGHRALLMGGQIQDIQCYGGVCVGRGSGGGVSSFAGSSGGPGRRGIFRRIIRR